MKKIYIGIENRVEYALKDIEEISEDNKKNLTDSITSSIYNFLRNNISDLVILKSSRIKALLVRHSINSMNKDDKICVLFDSDKVAEDIARKAITFNKRN